MSRLRFLALLLVAFCSLPPAASAEPLQNRIAIQVTAEDSKRWNSVLASIRNIQSDLGAKNVRIAVIAIGPGIGMLTIDSLTANGVQDAIAAGVDFVACGNSMKAQQVGRDDLADGVVITPAGYVEIMKRQQQGWAYLVP